MSEKKVMSAVIDDRRAYRTVQRFYEAGDLSDLGELVLKECGAYYAKDLAAEYVDVESLLGRLQTKYPKHHKAFEQFIDTLEPVSIANIMEDYCALKMRAASELAGSYLVAGDFEKARPYLDKFNQLESEGLTNDEGGGDDSSNVYNDAHPDRFTKSLEVGNRIPMLPSSLNAKLGGGLIAGCHLLIYAPPEVGKTAIAINTMYGFCNAGKRTMYVGNEESAEMYLNRMLCRFTRWPLAKVLARKDAAYKIAQQRGWANLTFIHLSPGSVPEIQDYIREHDPEVCIIDQLSNVNLNRGAGKELDKVQRLEATAYAMRMFYSKTKVAGVSLSQADEKAIGKLRLTIKDVYYSNVGLQGMYDVMLGIGMDDNYERCDRRMINITKNKIGGEHGCVIVQMVREVSMLRGIGDD